MTAQGKRTAHEGSRTMDRITLGYLIRLQGESYRTPREEADLALMLHLERRGELPWQKGGAQ
jgi:hypothetical protein